MKPIRHQYESMASAGAIDTDAAQLAIVDRLDVLSETLNQRSIASKGSALGWLFHKTRPEAPKGLYIWGSVGRGKTMLMDLFFDSVQGASKRRVHFHGFLADVHVRIHAFRQGVKQGKIKDPDPIPPVAAQLAGEAKLLCFDEFTVTDIADALILGRLFTALFEHGVVVVATSNVVPERLYEGGLNRALFMPFIGLLSQRMNIAQLDARTDFRMEKLGGSPVYYTPLSGLASAACEQTFQRLSGGLVAKPLTLNVLGHALDVPVAAAGVARFVFLGLWLTPHADPEYSVMSRDITHEF